MLVLTQELKETLKVKVSRMSQFACENAIKDCHLTLVQSEYVYSSPYAQKLWFEIDLMRDRLLALTKW